MKVRFTHFLSTATSFEPVSGNIDLQLGQHQFSCGKYWQTLDLFSFKIKFFTNKIEKKSIIFTC